MMGTGWIAQHTARAGLTVFNGSAGEFRERLVKVMGVWKDAIR